MVTKDGARELEQLPEEVRVCVQELLQCSAEDHEQICIVASDLHGRIFEEASTRLPFGSMTLSIMSSCVGVLAHAYALTAAKDCLDDGSRQVYAEAVAFLFRRQLKIAMTTEIEDGQPVLPDAEPH